MKRMTSGFYANRLRQLGPKRHQPYTRIDPPHLESNDVKIITFANLMLGKIGNLVHVQRIPISEIQIIDEEKSHRK